MKRGSNTVIPYEDIDHELVELIKCINDVEGIETVECCCGHGAAPCQIWFVADSLKDVTHFIHNYLYCNRLWRITIDITDVDIDKNKWDSPTYLLETTCKDYYYTGVCIDNLTYKMTMKQQQSEYDHDGMKDYVDGEAFILDMLRKEIKLIQINREEGSQRQNIYADGCEFIIKRILEIIDRYEEGFVLPFVRSEEDKE